MVARTADTLHALKFEVLKHPPYGLDLAPSDFHLFGLMNIWGARSLQMFILKCVYITHIYRSVYTDIQVYEFYIYI